MELWIRNQDKELLIKVDRIGIEEFNDEYGIVTYERIGTKNEFGLGLYTTKERALEVLDEIQNILKPQKIIKTIDNTVKIENALHIVNPTYETITQFDTYVYQMPKE